MKHFKQYNSGIQRRTHCNTFWIINNSAEALSLIRKLKGNRASNHVDTFDFSTLYTNIPHHLLLDSLGKLILEAYRVRGVTFICVSYNNIFWSNSQHREYFNSASKLVEYITFLVDNIFVAAGDQVFKQTVGIPMGTDCAPLLADLFLFFYEYNYVISRNLRLIMLQHLSGDTLPDI